MWDCGGRNVICVEMFSLLVSWISLFGEVRLLFDGLLVMMMCILGNLVVVCSIMLGVFSGWMCLMKVIMCLLIGSFSVVWVVC